MTSSCKTVFLFAEFFGADLIDWQSWLIPMVGVVAALVVFLVAQQLLARTERRLPPMPTVSVARASAAGDYDSYAPKAFGEKRTSLRRTSNPVPVAISNVDGTEEPCFGWVVNRSVGGLCLSVEAKNTKFVGTIFSVKATNAPDTTPWVQLEVRNCRQVGKECVLGCQFLKTPSWGILLLFG